MPLSNVDNKDSSSKYSDLYNNNCSDSEIDSLLNQNLHPIISTKSPHLTQAKINSLQMKVINNMPILFFVVFFIIIAILIIPSSYYSINNINKSKPINSLLQSFSMKVIVLISQFLFLVICCSLFTLTNQRMNVPEHQTSKASNYCFGLFSLFTIVICCIISIYNQETVSISLMLGLSDNVFNCLYMIFAILSCLFSFVSLMAFEGTYNSSNMPLVQWVITMKKVCIILMEVSLISYIISVILASIYPHQNSKDKLFVSNLVFIYSISSIAFLITYSFYVLSLRFDMSYIHSLLQCKPDIEYFFDESEYCEDNHYLKKQMAKEL